MNVLSILTLAIDNNKRRLAPVVCFCILVFAGISKTMAAPNFVVIVTDDQAYHEVLYMPNLKSLIADQGAEFTDAFIPTSLCCPSRSSIFRGQYSHNTGVTTNGPPNGGFEAWLAQELEASTLATWLQGDGYRTGLFGKYINGYPLRDDELHVPPNWDEWHAYMQGGSYFKYWMNHNGVKQGYLNDPEDYSTDVVKNLALTFLDESVTDGRPFLAYIATHAPHSPYTPAPRHEALHPDMTWVKPDNFNEADMTDKPDWMQTLKIADSGQVDYIYRLRQLTLMAVDDMIGELVARLESNGQLANTYIIFISDNGYTLGEHRLLGKGVAYDESIRVPLAIRGPGVTPGLKLGTFALNIDLAPTIAAAAGVAAPSFVDGRNLLPALEGAVGDAGWSEERFLVEVMFPIESKKYTVPAYSGVRTRQKLYLEWETGEKELYDITPDHDPSQLNNIYDTAPAGLINRLSNYHNALKNCAGADCLRGREQ